MFGNLPDSRPGTRSPRRRSGKDSAPAKAKKTGSSGAQAKGARTTPKPAPKPPSGAPRRQPTGQPADAPQPAQPGTRPDGIGSVEDLAWAGVAAAAEAATLGVRLAGRALDALRGNPERD